MANSLYDYGRELFLTGGIDFSNDTIKMALVTSAYTVDLANDQFFSSVATHVATADTVLNAAVQELLNKTVAAGVADCDDVDFGIIDASQTISYIVIYKDTGDNATSPLIAFYDSATGLPFSTSGSEITIKIDDGANKLFKL